MTAAAHNPNYGWRDNLDRDATAAANLVTTWTLPDVKAFAEFMTSFSPQAVQAFHPRRPSQRAGGERRG